MKNSIKKANSIMKLNCKFNHRGFATISLLLFLPVLVLMIFTFGFSGYLIQHKTKIRSTCLTEGRKIQEALANNEESILRLNPIAQALRLRLKLAYAELLAATAAANHPGIILAEAKILQIQQQQRQLDSLQKMLLQKTKRENTFRVSSMQARLNQIDNEASQIWNFYLRLFAFSSLAHSPEVALVRDSPDVAPVYELAQDHDKRQRLVFQWQTHFQTKSTAQNLLEAEAEVEFLCNISAKKEGTKWNLLINVGKS